MYLLNCAVCLLGVVFKPKSAAPQAPELAAAERLQHHVAAVGLPRRAPAVRAAIQLQRAVRLVAAVLLLRPRLQLRPQLRLSPVSPSNSVNAFRLPISALLLPSPSDLFLLLIQQPNSSVSLVRIADAAAAADG